MTREIPNRAWEVACWAGGLVALAAAVAAWDLLTWLATRRKGRGPQPAGGPTAHEPDPWDELSDEERQELRHKFK